MDGELNPNHPVTIEVHDHQHKIAALLMVKMGVTKTVITLDEIHKLEGLNIAIHPDDRVGIQLFLVSDKDADRLARKEGGLPV